MRLSTKVLVCVVGVLGNAGIWGDASIDTVLAKTYGYSKKSSESKNCARPCKFGQKPRRCVFDFRVEAMMLENRTALAINRQVPGPAIQVCLNDIVIVDVTNALPGSGELAFHWRGITQRGSPFMDGVPMITQCPIPARAAFKYVFKADQVGTHFYHAHSVSHHLAGLFGALVVRQPAPFESAGNLYDHDKTSENVLVVHAKHAIGSHPAALRINGVSSGHRKIWMAQGQKYRIRMINAIPLECPIVITVQNHHMTIISSDGREVKPTEVDAFILFPGERVDFVLHANQKANSYALIVQGMTSYTGLDQTVEIAYDGSNSALELTDDDIDNNIMNGLSGRLSYGQLLFSTVGPPADLTVSPVAEKSVSLKVDINSQYVDDVDNEYRYLSDAMPVPPFFPAELSFDDDDLKVVQINGKSFMYPNAPLLSQPGDIVKKSICPVGKESDTKGLECVQILEVEYKSTLELIIVDEGFGGKSVKTFHMHGNPMYVLVSSNVSDSDVSMADVHRMDAEGKIHRNLLNPPRKDTILVPYKGFTIVRILADNAGTWLFECRSCGVSSLPAAIVIKVKSHLPAKIIDTLPKCGNYKPADTLLN